MLFILAQELDVMHDVWWQTVLIFSVRVLILICDHGLHEKCFFVTVLTVMVFHCCSKVALEFSKLKTILIIPAFK